MPSFEVPGQLVPGSAGYICLICENPLIRATETSCQHKFCTYCINLWKKYHPFCPTCTRNIGPIIPRPDLDAIIDDFFAGASALARDERFKAVDVRLQASKSLLQNGLGNEMKALMEHLKPPNNSDLLSYKATPKVSANQSTIAQDNEIRRVLKDTERLERELNDVYSKIFTTGERLTAREDVAITRLCGTVFGGPDLQKLYSGGKPGGNYLVQIKQAATERASDGSQMGTTSFPFQMTPSTKRKTKVPQEQKELDALIELTDDVLRIDEFLRTFTFDNLLEASENPNWDLDEIPTPVDEDEDEDAYSLIIKDESLRSKTVEVKGSIDFTKVRGPDGTISEFKAHPEVQKYLEKCTTINASGILKPLTLPKIGGRSKSSIPVTPLVDESVEPYLQIGKTSKRLASQQRAYTKASNVDLTNKILRCRESLLNLKQKSEHEMIAFPQNEARKSMSISAGGDTTEGERLPNSSAFSLDSSPSTTDIDQEIGDASTIIRRIGREPPRPVFPNSIEQRRRYSSKQPIKSNVRPVTSLPSIVTSKK